MHFFQFMKFLSFQKHKRQIYSHCFCRLPVPPENLGYDELKQPNGVLVDIDYEIVRGDDLVYYCEDTKAVLSDGSRQNFFRTM